MKKPVVYILIAVLAAGRCSDNDINPFIDAVKGGWTERYHCANQNCDLTGDSLHCSVISFNDGRFSSALFRDSAQAVCDTSFTGKYSIASDTLKLILHNFTEVFYYTFLSSNLYLISAYSKDSKGNTIVDFRSVLWCCDKKKKGIFIPS